jgi:hypothetical protein
MIVALNAAQPLLTALSHRLHKDQLLLHQLIRVMAKLVRLLLPHGKASESIPVCFDPVSKA